MFRTVTTTLLNKKRRTRVEMKMKRGRRKIATKMFQKMKIPTERMMMMMTTKEILVGHRRPLLLIRPKKGTFPRKPSSESLPPTTRPPPTMKTPRSRLQHCHRPSRQRNVRHQCQPQIAIPRRSVNAWHQPTLPFQLQQQWPHCLAIQDALSTETCNSNNKVSSKRAGPLHQFFYIISGSGSSSNSSQKTPVYRGFLFLHKDNNSLHFPL